jgi:hypothetical protein
MGMTIMANEGMYEDEEVLAIVVKTMEAIRPIRDKPEEMAHLRREKGR